MIKSSAIIFVSILQIAIKNGYHELIITNVASVILQSRANIQY